MQGTHTHTHTHTQRNLRRRQDPSGTGRNLVPIAAEAAILIGIALLIYSHFVQYYCLHCIDSFSFMLLGIMFTLVGVQWLILNHYKRSPFSARRGF